MFNDKKIKKNIGKMILAFTFLISISLPMLSFAEASAATKAGNTGISFECAQTPAVDADGNPITDSSGNQIMQDGNCTFADLISAVQYVVNFAVLKVALPFSVVIITWAGILYMRSGGNAGKRAEANDMFVKVLWGIGWVLGAWLVISLIMKTLASSDVPLFLK